MACGKCSGNCGSCKGCSGSLEMNEWEIDMLLTLGQYSFLPVARKTDDMTPIYLEEHDHTVEEYSLILQCMERKGLISIDYHTPLLRANMSAYKGYPVHGCISLTERGYNALDHIETLGVSE